MHPQIRKNNRPQGGNLEMKICVRKIRGHIIQLNAKVGAYQKTDADIRTK